MQIASHSALEAIVKRIVELADQLPTVIVLIDGRAGSGKSTIAKQLQDLLFKELEQSPKVIHMDDLYPGWEGLRAGSQYLNLNILSKLAAGKTASWQVWDWAKGERGGSDQGNGWREYSGPGVVIVEGCGSLSRAGAEMAHLKLWLEADRATRRKRWEERDGHIFDEYWPIWEIQEDEFYSQEHSSELADLVIGD